MSFQTSDFKGDTEYSVECTGDAVVGDDVRFERATFAGSFRNATFAGFERVTGVIVRESYGADRQQHTFTLQLPDGSTRRLKGRVLYREGTWRKRWPNEEARRASLDEKHVRGDRARQRRDERREA